MRSLLIAVSVVCAAVAVWALSEKSRRDLQVRELRTELQVATTAARQAHDERDRAQANVAQSGSQLAAAVAELAAARVEAQRATGDFEAAKATVARLERQHAGAQDRALVLQTERDEARQQALARGRQVDAAALQRKTLEDHVRRLEADLQSELAKHEAIDALIDKTAAALRTERERHNADILAARKFMPEGVRQALLALNECLRADGQTGLRFMRASRIVDSVLHDVQVHDYDPRTLISRLYLAEELTFHLDRKNGSMTLLFKKGGRSSPGGRQEFPADGERLVLPGVDGQLWEKRLPFLVKASGDYPTLAPKTIKPTMRSTLRVAWARRLNKLLQLAKTETRYRLETFRDLRQGQFQDALLLGYAGRRLASSLEANSMWVHIDKKRSAVELRVGGGILRSAGGEAAIPDSGYRIQLPGVSPTQATDVMLGMVVRR